MFRKYLIILWMCSCTFASHSQSFGGESIVEGQWDLHRHTRLVHFLKLELHLPLGAKAGSVEASTLHVWGMGVNGIAGWQGCSNIDTDRTLAALAVLGYRYEWTCGSLFVGIRNVNEDFFTSPVTSLFTNSSCGIFPTLSACYPIADYPLSGLTIYGEITWDEWRWKNSVSNGVGYAGWTHRSTPFRLRPGKDGLFYLSQLEYISPRGQYYIGAAGHTRHFSADPEGDISAASASFRHPSLAWWVYGEQTAWEDGFQKLSLMAQYSENTDRRNRCYRYGELGFAYRNKVNQFGMSAQGARYRQGTEYSLEATWKRDLGPRWALQPSFQYIANRDGNFVGFSARISCRF